MSSSTLPEKNGGNSLLAPKAETKTQEEMKWKNGDFLKTRKIARWIY